jgi:hypothetical protein
MQKHYTAPRQKSQAFLPENQQFQIQKTTGCTAGTPRRAGFTAKTQSRPEDAKLPGRG